MTQASEQMTTVRQAIGLPSLPVMLFGTVRVWLPAVLLGGGWASGAHSDAGVEDSFLWRSLEPSGSHS